MNTIANSTTTAITPTDTVRRCVLAGTLALAPVALLLAALLGVDDPDRSGAAHLAAIAPDRDQFFTSNLLASLGFVLLAVGSYGVSQLARRRGGAVATAGWLLTTIGGIAAGAALFLYAAVLHAVTDPRLDRTAMGALDEQAGDSARIGTAFVIGFLGTALGLLLLAVGLWLARTVPVWMPALLGLGAVLLLASGSDETWVNVLTLSPLLVLIGIAAELLRPDRTIVLPGAPDDARSLLHRRRHQHH